jgi:hypothetical protein
MERRRLPLAVLGGAGAFDSSLPPIVVSPSNRLKAAHQSLSSRVSPAETTKWLTLIDGFTPLFGVVG